MLGTGELRSLAFAVVCVVLAGAARAQDAGGCMKDTECKGARICQNHVCVDPPPVVACTRDLDCPGDDICVERKCVAPGKRKGRGAPASATPAPSAPAAPAASAPAITPAPAPPPPAAAQTAAPSPAPAPAAPVLITPPPAAPQPAPPLAPVLITPPPPAPAPKREPAAAAPAPAAAAPAPAAPAGAAPPAGLGGADALPPPLVAAPVTIRRVEDDSQAGTPVFTVAVDGGLHRWTLGNNAEVDFGLGLTAEGGLRATENLSVEALVQGGWTLMAEGNNGLLLGIGIGVRADHLGRLPGAFTAGGLATFGSISGDKFSTIDFSGGAVLLQYALPLTAFLGGHAQVAYHFLNKNLSLLTLSVGVSFGN